MRIRLLLDSKIRFYDIPLSFYSVGIAGNLLLSNEMKETGKVNSGVWLLFNTLEKKRGLVFYLFTNS